jgi:hypothetical protein
LCRRRLVILPMHRPANLFRATRRAARFLARPPGQTSHDDASLSFGHSASRPTDQAADQSSKLRSTQSAAAAAPGQVPQAIL